jgi:hypothetical protein
MKSCSLNFDVNKHTALEALKEYCGTNTSQFFNYLSSVIHPINKEGDIDFTDEFKQEWAKNKRNGELSLINTDKTLLRDKIIDYFKKSNPSSIDFNRKGKTADKVEQFHYTNVAAREEAKLAFINAMISWYHENENNGRNKVTEHLKAWYCKKAIDTLNVGLARELSIITGIDIKEILKNLTDNNLSYVNKILEGHEDKVTIQLKNRIALYTEYSTTDLYTSLGIKNETGVATSNPRLEFFEEIMTNKNLGQIRFDKKDSVDENTMSTLVNEDTQQDGKNQNTDDATTEFDGDNTISTLNNKYGQYTDFMTHVGAPIRALLGSIRKMTTVEDSDGKTSVVYDTNNYLGIPLCMDANACASVLYHYGKYDSINTMMESIQTIAEQLPEYAGFIQLYKQLLANPNLQFEFYRTFKKLVMSRVETVVEDGKVTVKTSGGSNDTQVILYNRMINAFKGTSLTNSEQYNTDLLKKITISIGTYNPTLDINGRKLRNIATEISDVLKVYFPSISDISVRNYLLFTKNQKGQIDTVANLNNLFKELSELINGIAETRTNYFAKQSAITAAVRANGKARAKAELEHRIPTDKELVNLTSLYVSKYIATSAEAAITRISKLLASYTVVNKSLNERDIYGHQSSTVINDSMITNVIQTLQSGLNKYTIDEKGNKVWSPDSPIMRLGEHRSKSKQYDFSNILIEHTDSKGNIINQGLFRKDKNGNWTPTEYAAQLLSISQYSGGSNRDNGNNASYSDMSHGDYLSSSWKNFFNSEGNTAGYFMRIPSDAPKTFIVTAPKYSAKDLLVESNKKEINAEIQNIITTASNKVIDDISRVVFNMQPILVSDRSKVGNNTDAFVKHIQSTPTNTVDIKIPKQRTRQLKNDKANNIRVAFRYGIEGSAQNQNVYVMEGQYYDGQLHNASFVGFAKDSIDDAIWNKVKKSIRNQKTHLAPDKGGIKWAINTNNVLYKQLFNAFQQELLDMVVAGKVMFKTITPKDGYTYFTYDTKTHEPLLNNGYTNTEHNGLHPIYHFAESDNPSKRKIFEIKNGKIKLLGKVFSSNRFIIYDPVTQTNRNIGQEIIEEAFYQFIADKKGEMCLRFKEDKKGNIKVDISKAQQKIIDAKLQEFILKYIEEAREELNAISNLDNAEEFTSENLAEFVLNNHLTYIAFDDLFEGNSKFYKDSQTFLKRAKEVQGSGVPYGMADITRSIQSEHTAINSPLDKVEFFGGKKVQMYDGFSGVTIYNTIKTNNPMLETVVKRLTDKKVMGNAALDEKAARALLYGPKGDKGYQDTTVNDAQSYITFDEWIRRIAGRGKLAQYTPLINRILDESQPLNVEDLEELIQVQKNFYYDQYYNANTKVISPRQIKNAEFVLVPRLIKGTELEKIAQLMDKLGIDQLNTTETSKSGQGSRYTIWDETGNLTDELRSDLENIDNPDYEWQSEIMQDSQNDATKSQFKEYFNYNYLYTQLETPQHMGIEAENKAGIQIMKKIIDNIDENAPQRLKDLKKEYFKLYSANIKFSFEGLMRRLNAKMADEKIRIKNGEIEGLNYQELYDMLKDELTRLGMDSNALDYCTVDETLPFGKSARMPSDMSLVGPKFENIVQSIFNRNITRQTLPGFHASQITGIGFRSFKDIVDKSTTSNKLRYHYEVDKDGNYKFVDCIEIMLPCSAFGLNRNSPRYKGLSKEEQNKKMLQDLKDEGLDEIIGYRIPTEGKQSVCYMKVADFVDEAYGSTIVVPDDWVSQTGADMDGDSVYGIQYKTYKDKEGKVHKIKYRETFDAYNWMSYVSSKTGIKHEGLTDELFSQIKEDSKVETKSEHKTQRELAKAKLAAIEEDAWNDMDSDSKQAVILLHKELDKIFGKKISKEKYQAQLEQEIALLNNRLETIGKDYNTEEKQHIQDYIAIRQEILDNVLGVVQNEDNFDYQAVKSKKIKTKIEEYKLQRIENYEKDAEDAGLMSLEEYLDSKNGKELDSSDIKQDKIIEGNSAAARTNKLIEDMRDMLIDPHSLEENLSRSNFDDVSEALNKYNASNKIRAAKRAARSPYNIFSQAYYQEDAMSGAKLKGISVVRDTFCSVMNTVHPIIPDSAAIKIAYSKDSYTKEDLSKFGKVEDNGNFWVVTHNTFGWSKNNKNVDAKILTAYSSQTTAHILDAMKYGNVPNVNEYTFQIYKTFVDMGSNYDTAVSFIMQPGITKIVEAYNNSNSIYSTERSKDFVKQAVRNIADELNIEYSYTSSTKDIISAIEKQYGDAFRKVGLFGSEFFFTQSEEDNANIVLNAETQGNRIAEKGVFEGDTSSPVEGKIELDNGELLSTGELRSLYDLATILQFDKLNTLVTDIRTAAMVSNPDKFGAKQTIFATRRILDNIIRTIQDTTTSNGTEFRLQKDGKHILECIYPGITEAILNPKNEFADPVDNLINAIMDNDNFVKDSSYPFLAAFLKYSTIPSIVVNQTLFDTQKEDFRNIILSNETTESGIPMGLSAALSNGYNVTDVIAKDFKNYIVNYLVLHRSRFLQAPLAYDMGKGGKRGFIYGNTKPGEFNQEEANRIIGAGYPSSISNIEDGVEIPFTVNDINAPTQEEVNKFAALTPAQKIIWIQHNFSEAPLFNYVSVNLSNELAIRQGKAYQTIEFDEDSADIETVYNEFEKAFTNKHPFIALAAADIVKYAFYIEGYRIGIGNVSKMINNSVLINNNKIYGTGIVNDLRESFADISNILTNTKESVSLPKNAQLIENYIRGHYKTVGIEYHRVAYINKQGYEIPNNMNKGIIYLNVTSENTRKLAIKYGLMYEDTKGIAQPNHYVRLGFGKEETLYRICYNRFANNEVLHLIPLNPLNANENSVWSAIDNNNKYLNPDYYTSIMNSYYNAIMEAQLELGAYNYTSMKQAISSVNAANYKNPKVKKLEDSAPKPIKNINSNPSFKELVSAIQKWYPTSIVKQRPVLHVWNIPLGKYITGFGEKGEDIYTIKMADNSIHNFIIRKKDVNYYIKHYTGKNIDKPIAKKDEALGELIDVVRTAARNYPDNTILTSRTHKFGDIYTIYPTDIEFTTNDDEEMFSAKLDKAAVEMATSIDNRARIDSSDVMANNISMKFRDIGVKHNEKEIVPHTEEVVINTTKYLENTVDKLIDKFNHYIPNPNGEGFLPINSTKTIDIIKKDPILLRQYLKDILEPQRIIGQFGLIRDLDIDSEDPSLNVYLKKAKDAINKVEQTVILADAFEKLAQEYYDKATNNPLVKTGMISILDGYYQTNWLNATFNDIQETSNPIVQIAMRNFQADLRKREFAAKKQAKEFAEHIAEIQTKAKAAGKTVDFKNIIDEYGRFKQIHNKQFLEDRDRLKKAHDEATKVHGRGSIQELETRLAYDEWKAKYLEQPVVKSYYDEKNAILRKALYGKEVEIDPITHRTEIQGRAREIVSIYEQLNERRKKVRNKYMADVENPELDAEMDRLTEEIAMLTYNYEDDYKTPKTDDPYFNYDEASEEERFAYARHSKTQAENLKDYLGANRVLEHDYFKYDPIYDFDAVTEKNLKIVASFEQSDMPASTYADNPSYIKAKTWLRKNAELTPVWDEELRDKIDRAFEYISTEKSLTLRSSILRDKAYRGKDGRFDPRLVPAEKLDELKQEEVKLYGLSTSPISDKNILGNGDSNGKIYTKEFYEGVSGPRKSKSDNPKWQKLAKEVNELLTPYYDDFTHTIEISRIPNNAKGILLLEKLANLYDELDDIKGVKKSKATIKFIEKYVDSSAYNELKYNADMAYMKGLAPGRFKNALREVLRREDYKGDVVPNNYLYGILKPKAEYEEKFINKNKTEAIKVINDNFETKLRPEFEQQRVEMYVNHPKEYADWINNNTVYNPYTHTIQPLSIWTIRKPKADKFQWYPKFPQTIRVPRDGKFTKREIEEEKVDDILAGFTGDKSFELADEVYDNPDKHYIKEVDVRNKKYNPDGGHVGNFRKFKGNKYSSSVDMNEYELETMHYMQDVLNGVTKTKQGQRYLTQGWLPARVNPAITSKKALGRELLKIVGYMDETYDPADWYDKVDYSKDRAQSMPMLGRLKGKNAEEIGKRPVKGEKGHEEESDEAYKDRLEEWRKNKRRIELDTHKRLLDDDWINVIQDYLIKAAKYNAIQDNKYELFFARTLLQKYGHYITSYSRNGKKHYKKNYSGSNEDRADYLRTTDTQLVEQFDNTIRRLVYDQWKETNNPVLMKWMSVLQGLTSSQYMMMNIKGGIANVTLGESSIMQEVFAAEFFDKNAWIKGKQMYGSGILDYMQHCYGGAPSTLAGTIINFMDVVDYDEHTGVSRLTKDAYAMMKNFRNSMYTPQTAGEHEMQNSAMFSMMESHRIFEDDTKESFGKPKYRFMNYAEYVRDLREKAFKSILTEEELAKYETYVAKLKEDANLMRDYAHFRKDTVTVFAAQMLSKDKQKDFAKQLETINKKAKAEFNKAPTIMSQLNRNTDGTLGFKDGTILSSLSKIKDTDGINQAYQLLAEFKGRVISVNKFIHGVYDKSGRAQVEKTWIGSLLMQYHKHLPLGIMKRYRVQGYYNEERGAVQKGIYTSLVDFLSMPFNKNKEALGLTDENVSALQGIQNIGKGLINLAFNANTYYNLLPEYDKANIRRALSGTLTVLATIAATIAMKAGWDDDDSLLYNLALYEADRLSTEAAQYFPITAWGEGRKLYQSPIAAGSGITDALASMNMIAHMILDGEDFDGTYKSGKFAGENKLKVYIERRIPIYRGIKSSFIDIKDNNKFYKVSENAIGFINADDIAENIKHW